MSKPVKTAHQSKKPDAAIEDELKVSNDLDTNDLSGQTNDVPNKPDLSFIKSPSSTINRAALKPANILSLQRTIGNQAVRSLIQRATLAQTIQRTGTRLYVGNLSFNTTRESLESAFAAAGEVREVAIPTDRETGQPRGFAFVTMGSAQASSNAISILNGSMLDGRALKVNEAQERPSGGGGGGRGGGGGYGGGGGGGGRGRY